MSLTRLAATVTVALVIVGLSSFWSVEAAESAKPARARQFQIQGVEIDGSWYFLALML